MNVSISRYEYSERWADFWYTQVVIVHVRPQPR